MKYFEIQPGPAVSSFIKCYWMLEDNDPEPHPQTIVPDGRSELIINLANSFQHEMQGTWHNQPEVFLVGQITGPFIVRSDRPVRTIGIRFHPHGASRLFRMPMFELTDMAISLADVSKDLLDQVNRLRELPSLAQQIRSLENSMLAHAEQNEEDRLISFAVNQFERTNGMLGIRELSDSLGLSPRQFERRFRTTVGIPPKLFSRMQRFQHVFQTMEQSDAKWVDAAVTCGYYDQAHLIRDFREFSGTTPTNLISNAFELTKNFM